MNLRSSLLLYKNTETCLSLEFAEPEMVNIAEMYDLWTI